MVAGAARIRVTLEVDADGLLHVHAAEQSTGVQASIQVKPSYGLTDNEIEGMLRDSMAHAREDLETRRLREQQVEAKRVIEALEAALANDGERLLGPAERQGIDAALNHLRRESGSQRPDYKRIERAVEELEQACAFYVERRMNAGIRQAMAGRKLEEFE
jgi:molecular chaperone HscA